MSLTLIAWLLLFVVLSYRAIFVRAAWGFSVYALTFFACPPFWWWGKPISTISWSMVGGCVLLSGYITERFFRRQPVQPPLNDKDENEIFQQPFKFALPHFQFYLLLMGLNVSFVHYIIAGGSEISSDHYYLVLKVLLLTLLIEKVINTREDLKVVLFSLMLGIAYIGYQVTINEAGHFDGGRLEGVGAPGAYSSNFLACLTVSILPFSGMLIFASESRLLKFISLMSTAFIFNLLLLCNSRGSFLALIGAGFFMLIMAKRKEWKVISIAIILAIFGAIILIKDPKIINRFITTFASAEERDNSAAGRILLWQAGLDMVSDFPMGAGGSSFKRIYGRNYFLSYGITENMRAIHNGFITDATEWGIQWFILKILFLSNLVYTALKACNVLLNQYSNYRVSILGKSLVAGMVAMFIAAMFSDTFDAEWLFWNAALLFSFAKIVRNGYLSKSISGV